MDYSHCYYHLFYFSNCPKFATTLLDGSTHKDQCFAEKSIHTKKCLFGDVAYEGKKRLKCIAGEENDVRDLNDIGYWIWKPEGLNESNMSHKETEAQGTEYSCHLYSGWRFGHLAIGNKGVYQYLYSWLICIYRIRQEI